MRNGLGVRTDAAPTRQGGARTGLLVWLALVTGACVGEAAPGGFEAGAESGALPPDLPQSECDPRREDECPIGFKCSYLSEGAFGPTNRCVELRGEGLEGDTCTQLGDSDSCASHLVCWGTDAEGEWGRCVSFCSTALQCAGPEDICAVSNTGLLFLCLRACDPMVQDCGKNWGCYPDDNHRWSCDRDHSGELGQHADPCACLNCCDPGLVCKAGALVDGELCGWRWPRAAAPRSAISKIRPQRRNCVRASRSAVAPTSSSTRSRWGSSTWVCASSEPMSR